ncbi:cytochrome P450 [Cubamyces sp. BRFM 1775]|nr:cytochrome P450 [Cubamyces sp. BRFM 1775]
MSLITLPPLICAVLAAVLFKLWRAVVRVQYNSLRHLPGPESPSVLFGFAWQFWSADPTELHEEWVRLYGRTMSYRILSDICLFTMDTKALAHILTHDATYQKPYAVRTFIAEMLGTAPVELFSIRFIGEQHRRQRRVVNPAFGPLQIREFTGLFVKKACQLRDVLSLEVAMHGSVAKVDLYNWLHRMSLDVISEAAFGYDIGTLNVEARSNELCDAFRLVAQSVTRMSLWPMLRFFFPILRIFPEEQSRRFAKARRVMGEFASIRIDEKKQEMEDNKSGKHVRRRRGDFLTLLVEANMGASLPEGQRLSDETIIDECRTILVAGHDTTAITLSWFFYNIALYPEMQEKLRSELLSLPTDDPTTEELSSLHYLDCVLREVVRLYPVLPSSLRVATEDTVLPLGESVQINGQAQDRILVGKGTPIVIPILAINRDKALWGEDAFEFKPERWDDLPEAVSSIPGIWANNLTFMGGQHACLGYKFSLNEAKVAVFTLLRAFEFELGLPAEDVGRTPTMLMRPMRLSDPDSGPQLPVLVRPYRRE